MPKPVGTRIRQRPPITNRKVRRKPDRAFIQHVRQQGIFDSAGEVTIEVVPARPGRPVTLSRLVAAVGLGTSDVVLQDGFERVVATGWGTPDIGEPWAAIEGAETDFNVSGTVGVIEASTNQREIASGIDAADLDILVQHVNNGPGAANNFYRVIARLQSDETAYALTAISDASSAWTSLAIQTRNAGGVYSTIAVTVLPAAVDEGGGFMRFTLSGPNLSGSVWNAVEPAVPQVSAVDLSISAPGGVGVGSDLTAAVVSSWDNLYVVTGGAAPIWDAFLNDSTQLQNLVDSSVDGTNRWIPQVVNGQRLEQGEKLIVVGRGGPPGQTAILSGYMVHD